jgi:hypothetical protein
LVATATVTAMAKAKPQDRREPEISKDDASQPVDPSGPGVDPRSLVDRPDDPAGIDGPEAHAALPVTEQPEQVTGLTADGPMGDVSIEGPAARAIHDPGGLTGDGPQAGLSTQLDGLDDLLAGQGGYGGADGRNDASDAGGMGDPDAGEPDFGATSPVGGAGWHGLDGAAGKLNDWQKEYVNKLNDQMKEAQTNMDHEKVNKIAEEVAKFTAEARGETPGAAPATEGEGDPKYDLITNYGSGAPGETKQVWNPKTGEVEQVPADTPTNNQGFVTEAEQMKQTGTDSGGNQETPTTTPPAGGGGVAEDREWEGEAPDMHADFIEAYHQQQTGADRGGAVDPNPEADSGMAVMDGDAGDYEPYVAEYEPGTEFTDDQIEAAEGRIDRVPDEEFMDL